MRKELGEYLCRVLCAALVGVLAAALAAAAPQAEGADAPASAPPAGTSQAKAAGTHTLPSRRISSLSSPAALSSRLAFRELEHTSSANPSR